jgi:hypothetical protein
MKYVLVGAPTPVVGASTIRTGPRLAALTEEAAHQRCEAPERPIDRADWQQQMNRRLRAEFMAGAEEEHRRRSGPPMTAEELERVLRQYPGDV